MEAVIIHAAVLVCHATQGYNANLSLSTNTDAKPVGGPQADDAATTIGPKTKSWRGHSTIDHVDLLGVCLQLCTMQQGAYVVEAGCA